MKQSLFTLFTALILLGVQNCFGQLNDEENKIIKLYPPIKRNMINPKSFSYKTKDGTVLTYSESEGRMRFTKGDSLAEIDKFDQLDELSKNNIYADYTDGGKDSWVNGKLTIGNMTYSLYGAYIAEGYLEGVAYDKNNKVFGVMKWENNKTMTATLKTQTKSYEYNFERQPSAKIAQTVKPSIAKSDALKELLQKNNSEQKPNIKKETGFGTGLTGTDKNSFYINDFLVLHDLNDEAKVEQLKKWGWITERQVKDRKDNLYVTFHKNRTVLMSKIVLSYLKDKKTTRLYYEITMANQSYINKFVEDAKTKGFVMVTDKDSVYKLIHSTHTITINNSVIEFNEQYYTIRIE